MATHLSPCGPLAFSQFQKSDISQLWHLRFPVMKRFSLIFVVIFTGTEGE